jgi:hypothetical protein
VDGSDVALEFCAQAGDVLFGRHVLDHVLGPTSFNVVFFLFA